MNDQFTAQEWFSAGTRVTYDPVAKKMVERAKTQMSQVLFMCGSGLSGILLRTIENRGQRFCRGSRMAHLAGRRWTSN